MSDHLIKTALSLHLAGNLTEASRLYNSVLRLQPKHFDALYLLGVTHFQRGEFEDAQHLIGKALKINPRFVEGLRQRGSALQQLNRHGEAIRCFDQALLIEPDLGEIALARGVSLSRLGRHRDALNAYDQALGTNSDLAVAWNMRGNALLELGRGQDALASYDRAIRLKADYAEAWRHRGLALSLLDRVEEAITSFDRALALQPNDADSWEDRGTILMRMHAHADAAIAYDRALSLRPTSTFALYNRGNAYSILKRYEEAIRDCERVLAVDPDYPYARGVLIHCKLQSCDWGTFESERKRIEEALYAGKRVVTPLNHKALSDSASEQLRCAQVWVRNELPQSVSVWHGERYRHDRIRLAYVSADLNTSNVASLMAGVFEQHDRTHFETIAISFGPDTRTPMRSRLEAAFDHFVEARLSSEAQIAARLKQMEADIVIDLMGFTGLCRSKIFTPRPAPIQVNYLGFPGTMAADWIDYILADRTVIPEDQRSAYSESVVYLPDCFMPADRTRAIADRTPTRAEAGLPSSGFVFASFNNASKFSPEMFDVWMRLLLQVEGSVLWLPEHHSFAVRNLKREAERRGVAPARLIFAPFVPSSEAHLARLRCADLCLDTLPYNAHTTANDALWAGLPVLTCLGNSFGGRVAASLLHAVRLPELVTRSLADYEATALSLAREPERMIAFKLRLERNRDTCPLFDTARFTRNLEAAFTIMWERHQKGEPPADLAVENSA